MKKGPSARLFVFGPKAFKASVRSRRGERLMLHVKKDMQRMRWDNEMNEIELKRGGVRQDASRAQTKVQHSHFDDAVHAPLYRAAPNARPYVSNKNETRSKLASGGIGVKNQMG